MKEILETTNYDLFKKLGGNRATSISRINKIKNSILNVGYITSPILVNENMEIIDGQGRFEALKELEMPIEYIIQKGLNIKECIAMNINQTNWNILDYIQSYADKGNQNYIYFIDLINTFPKLRGMHFYSIALSGRGHPDFEKIKSGDLIITEEEYEKAKEKLKFIYPIKAEFSYVKRIDYILKGLLYCLNMEMVDKELLKRKIIDVLESGVIPPMPTIEEVMQFMEKIYNKNKRGYTVYIYTEYRKGVEERIAKGFNLINNNKQGVKI